MEIKINIYKKMTSSELQFAVIKDELTAMVDDIIRQLHYLPKRICFNELQLNLLMEPQPRRISHCQI